MYPCVVVPKSLSGRTHFLTSPTCSPLPKTPVYKKSNNFENPTMSYKNHPFMYLCAVVSKKNSENFQNLTSASCSSIKKTPSIK